MKAINWTEVTPASESTMLPAGAYVAKIVGIEDNPSKERLEVVYDIAEGEHKDHFADLEAKDAWRHTFFKSYTDRALPFFRRFLDDVEAANQGRFTVDQFSQSNNENLLVGMNVGILVREKLYTADNGDDRKATEVADTVSVDKVRSGNYKIPEPRDTREVVNAPAVSTGAKDPYDEAVPF